MGSLFQNRDNLRSRRVICLQAASALLLIAAAPSSAYAFNVISAPIDTASNIVADVERKALVAKSPPSSVTDLCVPLLTSIHTSPSTVTDRNQRSAGISANPGLVLGVRFALSVPVKTTATGSKTHFGFWQSNSYAEDRLARAVSSYAECRNKNQAVEGLSTFRWQR